MKTHLMMAMAAVGMMAGSAFASAAVVNDVLVRQRWPWSKKVDISFVLGATDVYQDVTLTAYNGTTKLGVIPEAALTGTTVGLPKDGGRFSVVLDPEKAGFGTDVLQNFRVEVATADSTYVLYKIVNLVTSNVTDVTVGDITRGKYGAWQQNPVAGVSSLIWTGVTNADVWATTNLVLRRVKAGSFYMGYNATNGAAAPAESQHVTLSRDFYIGVFEVTQRQYELVAGTRPSYYTNDLYYATRPVEWINYGYANSARSGNWPAETLTTDDRSFVYKLNARMGGTAFELPTEAQWEYACRAGTQTELNIGVNYSAAAAATVARCAVNQGDQNCDLSAGTMRVGSYRPNAWGLYDMHGNAAEWCRDKYGATIPASINNPQTTDPTGPYTGAADANPAVSSWLQDRVLQRSYFASTGAAVAFNRTQGFFGSTETGFRIILQQ